MLDSSASGLNTVEREGVSIVHPARFIMIGSGNPQVRSVRACTCLPCHVGKGRSPACLQDAAGQQLRTVSTYVPRLCNMNGVGAADLPQAELRPARQLPATHTRRATRLCFDLLNTPARCLSRPQEGELRPQLLDRFGMSVNVATLQDTKQRTQLVLDR